MTNKPPAKCNNCQEQIIFKQEGTKPDGSAKWVRYDYLSPETKHVCNAFQASAPPKASSFDTKVAASAERNNYAERDAQIQKAHEDNLKMHQEKMAFEREKFDFDKMMFSQNQALILQIVDLTHQVQLLVTSVVELKQLFKKASEMVEAKTQ